MFKDQSSRVDDVDDVEYGKERGLAKDALCNRAGTVKQCTKAEHSQEQQRQLSNYLCPGSCSVKTLHRMLPISVWLPAYSKDDFIGDLVAGISVGLTSIPQVLAYTSLSGLDLQYGLYASFLGSLIYIFVGSSKDVPMGPSAISALLTLQIAEGSWQYAVLLTFLSGLVEIVMGLLRLGFLHDFVSGPVNAGFLSAVSLIILTTQLRDLLGIELQGRTCINMWFSIIENVQQLRWCDCLVGVVCILLLLCLKTLTQVSCRQLLWQKTLWFIGTARFALVICATGGIGYWLQTSGQGEVLRMVGYVPAGLPSPSMPPFQIDAVVNQTTGEVLQPGIGLYEMVEKLGAGIFVVPLIALLETMAVVNTFAPGSTCDASQELLASGVCNVANAFVQGIRSNGGIARAAVLASSGVRTPLSNLYSSAIIIVSLLHLTPLFYYIPRTVLAAIIMTAVISLVQYRILKPMWRTKKTDLIPGLSGFFACLVLRLQIGILIGIGINVLFILYQAARPRMRIETLTATGSRSIRYLMLTPDRCLIFPSAEFVCNTINKLGVKSTLPLVIDCTHIYGADFTAARVVSRLISDFELRRQPLYFYNLRPGVARVFLGVNRDFVVFYDAATLEAKLMQGTSWPEKP